MAELATLPENRNKLEPEISLTTSNMVEKLEEAIDEFFRKNFKCQMNSSSQAKTP